MRSHLSALTLIATLPLLACGKSEPAAPEPVAAAAPVAEPAPSAAPTESADDVYKNRCTPCHGTAGKGDGPAAAALNPKPRDYTDPAWQKSVTDEDLKKTILYGGAAVGKSAAMPSQPDLESKPEVLAGMIKIIRDYAPAQ